MFLVVESFVAPRSPDLYPPDGFLWGAANQTICRNRHVQLTTVRGDNRIHTLHLKLSAGLSV